MPNLTVFLLWYFTFLFSTVVHEASHAWSSMKLGDYTAYEGGQVSMDPVPHIRQEPFGMVVVPLFTFILNGWMMGWASAPYDPRWAMHHPRSSALVSLAGPLSNLGIVFITGFVIRIGVFLGVFYAPDFMGFDTIVSATQAGFFSSFSTFLSIMFSLNVLLFVFNLIPVPPLDGSGIIPLFLKEEETAVRYMNFIHNPALYMGGIFLAWYLFDFIFTPLHTGFVNILYLGLVYY